MKSNRLLTYLKSNNFALLIAILSVAVQSFHSFTAFYNTSGLKGTAWGIAQAALFALIVDMAILFYTLRRRSDIARIAALAMVIINAYYYFQHLGLTLEFIFGVFLSLIIPVSVYFYSEEIGKEDIDETTESRTYWRDAFVKAQKQNVDTLAARCTDAENLGTLYAGKIDQLKSKNEELAMLNKYQAERLQDQDLSLGEQERAISALREKEWQRDVNEHGVDALKYNLQGIAKTVIGMDQGSPGGDKAVKTTFAIGPDGPEIVSSEEVDRIPFETATSQRDDVTEVDYEEPEEKKAADDIKNAKRNERLIDAIRNRNYDVIDKIAAEELKDRWIILEEAKDKYRKYVEDTGGDLPF